MTDGPARGDVWLVRLDPAEGSEANKTRPAIVVHAPAFSRARTRIVVPVTEWRPRFESQMTKVRIPASETNGLSYESAADVLHIRSVAIQRFESRLGTIEQDVLGEIAAGIVVAVGYVPTPAAN